jgi:hydroxypyruvate isomerase
MELAAAAGFRGVELSLQEVVDAENLGTVARRLAIEIVLIALPPGDLIGGGYGYMGVPGRWSEVESMIQNGVRIADTLACRRLSLPPSRIPQGLDRASCLSALIEHLGRAADLARPYGVDLVLEPINSINWPGFLISSTQDALEVIGAIRAANVGLQLDLYHAAMQGEVLTQSLQQAAAQLRHVQFADVPGRHEPGTGSLPLRKLLLQLDELNYKGWAGAEYYPTTSGESSLSWLSDWTV